MYVLFVNDAARELLLRAARERREAQAPGCGPWAVVSAWVADLPAGLALARAAARQRGWGRYELTVQDAAGPDAIFAGLDAALGGPGVAP